MIHFLQTTTLGTLTSGHIQLISKLILVMQKKERWEYIMWLKFSGWLVGWMDGRKVGLLLCWLAGKLVTWLGGWMGRCLLNCPPVSSCKHSDKWFKKQRKWKLWRMWNSTLKISKEWNHWTKLHKKDTHLLIWRMVKKYNDWTIDKLDKIIWKPTVIFAFSNKQRMNESSSAQGTLQKSSAAHDIKSPDSTVSGISTAPTLKFYG